MVYVVFMNGRIICIYFSTEMYVLITLCVMYLICIKRDLKRTGIDSSKKNVRATFKVPFFNHILETLLDFIFFYHKLLNSFLFNPFRHNREILRFYLFYIFLRYGSYMIFYLHIRINNI